MNHRNNDRVLRQVSTRRRRRDFNPVPLWILLGVLIVALTVTLCLILPGRQSGSTGEAGTDPAVTTVPAETERYPGYTSAVLAEEDLHRGDLILVNAVYPFIFPDEGDIVSMYTYKTGDYKLAESSLQLDAGVLQIFNRMLSDFAATMDRQDVIVNSGYRTYEEQEQIYNDRLAAYGREYAEAYVAHPGYSEHHTGYAMDMAVYTDAGVSMTFDQDADFNWFYDAAHTYGFVLRYAANKIDLTGISSEPWHFRYVGKPHAYYMYAHDLCLEEYITLLRSYPFEGQHLTFRDDEEQAWEIYYVAATGERTELYVPSDRPYTISGNNCNGYIVTAEQ